MSTAFLEAQNGHVMNQANGGDLLILADALRLLPTPACILDAAGRIVGCNAKATGLWGREPGPEDTWASMAGNDGSGRQFQALLESGQAQTNAALTLCPSPETRLEVLANAEPVWDEGEYVGTVVTFQSRPESSGTTTRFWDMLDVLPAAICVADPEGRLTYFNQAAADLWGAVPEEGSSLWSAPWRVYGSDGSVLPHDETPMAIAIRERRPVRGVELTLERPDGSRVAILPHPTPLYDATGRFIGAVNMMADITHQKVAEDRHILFARELNHRVKNALATVYAIAMQTLRYTDSLESFRESFSSRLLALSRAHDLLVRCQWQETPLKIILAEALSAFGSSRLDVEGDDADFGPRATLTLAMTFHELVTNAARFGALAEGEGSVEIRWRVVRDEDGERMVALTWRETGGPRVEAPVESGFGSRLINHNLMALGGSIEMDYAAEGLCCEMKFPVINEAPGWPAAPATSSAARPSGETAGPASPGELVR